jgi:hypothetical protein
MALPLSLLHISVGIYKDIAGRQYHEMDNFLKTFKEAILLTGSRLWSSKIILETACDNLFLTAANDREGNSEEGFSKHFRSK